MRCSSTWKGFLWAATVIGAALFSGTASATTLTVLPTTIDPVTKFWTISILVSGNSPTGFVNLHGYIPNTPFSGDMGRGAVGPDGIIAVTGQFASNLVVSASYTGDAANPPAFISFTVPPPGLGWLPTVLGLLSD
jgi:hypothetical protein